MPTSTRVSKHLSTRMSVRVSMRGSVYWMACGVGEQFDEGDTLMTYIVTVYIVMAYVYIVM